MGEGKAVLLYIHCLIIRMFILDKAYSLVHHLNARIEIILVILPVIEKGNE